MPKSISTTRSPPSGSWARKMWNVEFTLSVEWQIPLVAVSTSASAPSTVQAVSPPLDEIRLSTVPISLNTLVPNIPIFDGTANEVLLDTVRVRPDLQGGVFGNLVGAIGSPQTALAPATLPVEGSLRLCFVSESCNGPSFAWPLGSETPSGYVGAGVGGLLTIVPLQAPQARISVYGAPWTVHTATISQQSGPFNTNTFTRMGFAHGPASLTGTTTLTSGVLNLVTATQVEATNVPFTHRKSGTFERLSIRFVPEPSGIVTWLAGTVALLAGLRRRNASL